MASPSPIVLIVDDEPSVRDLFARIVGFGSFLPVAANDAEDALRLFAAGLRPDAVLLDLKMPGMSGLELLARMRMDRELARLPVAIVTGDTFISEESRLEAAALGAKVYFKPVTMDELLLVTERLTSLGTAETG